MNWGPAIEAAAITVVFVRGSIFEPLRAHGPKLWRELVSCALCSGFWIGAVWRSLALWLDPRISLQSFQGWVFAGSEITVVGALTGVSALLVVQVLDVLDRWS